MTRETPGYGFDWDAAKSRLVRAATAMRDAVEPTPDRVREILRARAHKLARPIELGNKPDNVLEIVVFRLGNERYAIDCVLVHAIVRLRAYTAVPGTAPHVLGVTNHRGTILPIFNLHRFFGLETKGISDLSHIIAIGRDSPEIGLLVDAVENVDAVDLDTLVDTTNRPESADRSFHRGVGQDALIVLDGKRLLTDPQLTNPHA